MRDLSINRCVPFCCLRNRAPACTACKSSKRALDYRVSRVQSSLAAGQNAMQNLDTPECHAQDKRDLACIDPSNGPGGRQGVLMPYTAAVSIALSLAGAAGTRRRCPHTRRRWPARQSACCLRCCCLHCMLAPASTPHRHTCDGGSWPTTPGECGNASEQHRCNCHFMLQGGFTCTQL